MSKNDKPIVTLHQPRAGQGSQTSEAQLKPPALRRSEAELEPLAYRVLENNELMKRLRAAVGSNNEAVGRAIMDEIRAYAQSLDPTATYSEGTKIVAILLRKIGHFRGELGSLE